MTDEQAEKAANFLIGAAAIGAAIYILRNPSLRRLAWQLAKATVLSTGPGWLLTETRRGWNNGGRTGRDMMSA